MRAKILKKLVAIFCILVIVIPTPLSVIAKISNSAKGTKQNFGIEVLHTSSTLDKKKEEQFGYATDTSTKPTYRIYAGSEDKKDYETTILCLNKDKRYPQENGVLNAEYESLGDATKTTLQQAKGDLTDDDVNKILWLIKNAIAPEDSESMKDLKLAKLLESELSGSETSKLTLDQVKSVLTDDDLVFAMQFVLWEVTNHITLGAPQGTRDGENWAALNGSQFKYKGKYIVKLIEAYGQQLQNNQRTDLIDDHSANESNLIITGGNGNQQSGNITPTQEGGYAYIGPFKITGSEGNDYTVKISLLTDNGADANSNFFILDAASTSGNKLSSTKKDLDNKNFWIQVRTNTPAKKVKIELETGMSIKKAKGYVWTRNSEDQPLLSLEREENKGTKKQAEFTFNITNTKEYDVALRKYISTVKRPQGNNQWQLIWEDNGESDKTRKPKQPDAKQKQSDGAFNQYEYKHRKDPLEVQVGDRITYTIEVINEQSTNITITEVKDYLPPTGLKYVTDDSTNTSNWTYDDESRTATTKAFENFSPNQELQSRTVKIVCEVTAEGAGKVLTNIAEITKFKDKNNGTEITEDLDSGPGNVQLPKTEEDWENYTGNESNQDNLDDPNYYYKGQQDDDDFEKVKVKAEETDYDVQIKKVDKDDTEKGLQGAQFLVTLPSRKTETITTENGGIATTQKIKITNTENESISFKEIKAPEGYKIIDETFILDVEKEIKEGQYVLKKVTLRENSGCATLDAKIENKKIVITVQNKQDAFDLRLRKFITKVGDEEVTDRTPRVNLDGDILKYEHTKNPKLVKKGERVEYTIRVYNEGVEAGYAAEIKDDIPEGLKFLKEDSVNTEYGWKMYTEGGQPTDNVDEAKIIKTDYLSKDKCEERHEQALQAFKSKETIGENNPDHKDVKVAFEVTATEEGQEIVNTAEIAEDKNEQGEDVEDVDSTPNNGVANEDDIDKEYLKLKLEDSDYKIQIEKVDKDNPDQKLQNAEFTVTLPGGTKEKLTTGENGTAETSSIKITNKDTETIEIEETKAPEGYKQVNETFTIEVTKDAEDGHYVLKTLQLKEKTENAELSVDIKGNKIVLTVKDKKEGFDLRLRKFITQIDETKIDERTPKVTYENGELKYEHSKVAKPVKKGQKVIYTIRVYNESKIEGYAAEIKDDLPYGITFLPNDQTNIDYGWKMYDQSGQETENVLDAVTIRTNYLSKEKSEDNLLKAFDPSKPIGEENPDHRDVKVAFEVTLDPSTEQNLTIINTAEISKDQDKDGNEIDDTDSIPDNNQEGEDDIDKEYIQLELEESEFKLKIEKVDENNQNVKLANAEFTVTLPDGKTQKITTGSDGIAEIPSIKITKMETESISIKETKAPQGYELINETFVITLTKGLSNGYYVITNATLTNDTDIATLSTEENTLKITIKNKPAEFDLALRKYITQIGNQQISDREPKVSLENGKLKYEHSKNPLTVVQGQKIVYTIRVYNEGKQNGYAAEIRDDLPEGLTFLPNDEINKKYGWKMYDSHANEVQNASDALEIRTNYLSKEESEKRGEDNLLKAFDSSAGVSNTNPDYRDVKVAFQVNTDSMSSKNKTIINTAEISQNEDESGNEVEDIDSKPDNGEPDEDDIDKEYVEPKYFDLSLLKYVSKVIVTEDGVTKETETGYDGTENPEPIVKVELDRKKLDKTEVKYIYTIKITNEGEIEGYATEITDRIPEGLEFYEEDNKQYGWKVKEKGLVTTDYLKDKLLQPGESATVQIVLRWIKSDKNLGQKINVAEITADDNPYDAPDIDSTPNNNKDGEDDQDDAAVMLSITTGAANSYIILAIGITTFIGFGCYVIVKHVIMK